jgi:type IV pilus assembly protein PilQ
MLERRNTNSRRKITNVAVAWFVIIAALAALVIAQVQPSMEVVEGTEAYMEEYMTPEVAESEETIGGQAIQSLSFKEGTTISAALRMLALKYQKNIVRTERVEGQITVTDLFNVTFEEALQALIGTNKFDIHDNFIKIYTPEEYEQLKADTRRMEDACFVLHYMTSDEAQKMIEPLLSGEGKISVSTGSERGVPSGESISSDSAGGDSMAFQDTVVVFDYPENIARVERLIAQLDVRPKQVLIEATILTVRLTEGMEFGVDLNFANGVSITGTSDSGGTQDDVLGGVLEGSGDAGLSPAEQVGQWTGPGTPIEVAGFANIGGSGLRVGVSAGSFVALIHALEEITDMTVLANPKILAVNKQLGQVYIGRKLGYREGDIITDGGATQEGAVKYLDTGTKLAFRPFIGDNGYIRMQIHPKDSTGAINAQGVPDEDSSEVATNVIVRDGQTIIIGGMFRNVVTSTTRQVPVLGNIPILGDLFKSFDDTSQREEVIVLMTPHIIDDPDELSDNDRIADAALMEIGARRRLRWMSVSWQADTAYRNAVELYSDGDSDAALRKLNWALHLRPTYIQAIRLRDEIIRETAGDSGDSMERIMIDRIQQEEMMWFN